ncbi:TetR/AcrR family transcriptional regulator [Bradyrhizobium sp. HKCCYLS1011]|uniref:TetR/AcrR family transcriptional regulator n=1 Tax=Bradyrhizobium sp. HKCCYLS1011 TaxID=3420733 RepID=UPI003EBF40D6
MTDKRTRSRRDSHPPPSDQRERIARAALALFTTQGFHGSNTREIADRAGVSSAAIYTFYPSKEAIFGELAQQYRARLDHFIDATVRRLKDPLSKRDLRAFASAIWTKMQDEPEILLLVLIDVIEFKFQHFQGAFDNLPARMRAMVGTALTAAERRPGWRGHDPAFVLAAVYHYFFHFALIEKHMRGNQHLGVSNELAIKRFVDLLYGGLWSRLAGIDGAVSRQAGDTRVQPQLLEEAARDRIEFIRLLCGRLWHSPPTMSAQSGRKGKDDAKHKGRDRIKVPMLFLPQIAPDRPDDNQLAIEAAALALFTTQGFHGTNIRDIADRAGVSQGAIYTYYPKKEKIFESLVRNYQACMLAFTRQVITLIEDPFSRSDLRLLATAVRSIVYDEAAFLLLMFIDVIEFKNRHFAALFHDIPAQFRYLLGPVLDRAKRRPGWCGQDPAFVLATIYLFFYNYFVIERHMLGNQHLGLPEPEAIERLIDVLSTGLWSHDPDAA